VPIFTVSLTLVDMLAEGQQLRYCGVGANFEEVIIQGNPDELKVSCLIVFKELRILNFKQFIAYYIKNNKIVAVSRCDFIDF
jgi:hypothetical protein